MLIAGCGGFFGTCVRYGVCRLCSKVAALGAPLGTLTVNLLGCLLIGVLMGLAERNRLLTPSTSLLLITGFCGAFTTFSTFASDAWNLFAAGRPTISLLYLLLTIVVGVLLVPLGRSLVAAN